jgi:HSP20 family protein
MFPSLTRFPGDLFADFDGLHRQLDQLLGLSAMPSSIRAASRGAFPAINLGTTDSAVEIYAFAPGLDPAAIDISVDKGLLTLSGERKSDLEPPAEGRAVYAQERFVGKFRRVVSLPEDVDNARVEATYRDGVLKIVVPRREASKPKRIEIK